MTFHGETEADTRAERIHPKLRDAGWGVVDGSRIRREVICLGRIQTGGTLGTASWEEGFSKLQEFIKREGHCRVPAVHKEGDLALGYWIGTQRKTKGTLTPERIERLDALGFVWKVR